MFYVSHAEKVFVGGGGGVVEMGKTLGEFDTGDILNHFL